MRLTDFKVMTFDCYGTLIDWETGMFEALKPLVSRVERPLSRDEVLQAHARHESAQQITTPTRLYKELLAVVYKRLAEEWGVPASWRECITYGLSVRDWPPFPDSVEALQYLKKHFKLAIVSNVDNESFSFSNEMLQVEFDAIFTAEDIGSYKPSPHNFDYMLEKLAAYGFQRGEILHTAESLFHDIKPANDFGLATCRIHRRHGQKGFGATMDPGTVPSYNFRFVSMADLAKFHQDELRGLA